MKKYKPNISISNKIYSKAKKIIPAGSQTFSKGTTQFVDGFAPKYLHRGKGAYVWDVDKNKYLDYVMGCQPIILGYADPDVNKAVINQLELGSTFSLMNKLLLLLICYWEKLASDAVASPVVEKKCFTNYTFKPIKK